jgi:hypothetical protein
MKFLILVTFLLFTLILNAQDRNYQFTEFQIFINGNKVTVLTETDSLIFERTFNNLNESTFDLDADGNSEFIVFEIDSLLHSGYIIYLFNTLDEFFLIDSILAGITEPSIIISGEINFPVINCGNPDFEIFFSDNSENYEPINLWKFEQGELYLANEDVYEIYLKENENLIEYINGELGNNNINCESVKPHISAIASVYANYINAGEVSTAVKLIKKYYPCKDLENFQQTIDELLFIKEE